MKPVSILNQHFEQKVESLRHDEARASVMEHAIRTRISERLADNPVLFEKPSAQLEGIINELRQRPIGSAEACKRMAALRYQSQSEADIAARQGLTPVSFAVCEMINGRVERPASAVVVSEELEEYSTKFDEQQKEVARQAEEAVKRYQEILDWQ